MNLLEENSTSVKNPFMLLLLHASEYPDMYSFKYNLNIWFYVHIYGQKYHKNDDAKCP